MKAKRLQRRSQSRAKARSVQRSDRSIRLLTAVPVCDGHDSAINTINLEFTRHGFEVVYLGYHRSARDIVRAAVQENVQAIGISTYNGGHIEFFAEVRALLKKSDASDIGLFGGGGGTITPADARLMERNGVDRIFFPGTPLAEMVEFVRKTYADNIRPRVCSRDLLTDRQLAGLLTAAEAGLAQVGNSESRIANQTLGITGPGGAGKTTLIDELVLRFLKAKPEARLAILSHDPTIVGKGALLGDRAAMIYSQNDRVFMHSLATRGQAGGLSPATKPCLQILKNFGFDLVLIETVGIGQEALPFQSNLVDRSVVVTSPDYGSRLQLQKIAMLEIADVIVVNKADLPGAKTATAEIEQRLAQNARGQKLVSTVAKRHRDSGVDELFRLLFL